MSQIYETLVPSFVKSEQKCMCCLPINACSLWYFKYNVLSLGPHLPTICHTKSCLSCCSSAVSSDITLHFEICRFQVEKMASIADSPNQIDWQISFENIASTIFAPSRIKWPSLPSLFGGPLAEVLGTKQQHGSFICCNYFVEWLSLGMMLAVNTEQQFSNLTGLNVTSVQHHVTGMA